MLLEHTIVLVNIASSTINSSQFISNKGGAINFERGELSIISCEFTNNSALLGGAVSTAVDTVLIQFISNKGGAIDFKRGELSIINSEFTNNSALFGGTVHTVLNSMVTVKNSSFVRNNANTGGAIFGFKSTVVVFNNSFTENTAFTGGAVHIQQAQVRIVDTNFTENKALGIGGAVTITLDAPFTIRDSTFNANTANNEAGAIVVHNTLNMDINQNPIFSDLNQEIRVGFVKSKKLNTHATGYLLNNTFYDNTGETSSAFFGGTAVEISHCDFIGNGKIMLAAVPQSSISHSLFENNTDGAVMAANCSMPLVITNSQFINNAGPFDKKGPGAVIAANCSIVISNSTFARNSRIFGAAITVVMNILVNTLHITNSSFQSNNATTGGAIFVVALADNNKIHLEGCKFIQNTAVAGASAVLFGNITADFSYCGFYGNSARKGSGIVGHGNITIKVSDSSFINNAGIIKGQTAQQIVMDSTPLKTWKTEQGSPLEAPIVKTFLEELEELSKNKENEGSLLFINNKVFLTNCSFLNNSGLTTGGIFALQSEIYMKHILFYGHHAGTMTLNSSKVKIYHSTFIDNSGSTTGTIYILKYSSISLWNCIFHSNKALGHGAVLKISGNSTCNMVNCLCLNNSAHYGGAVHVGSQGQVNIKNTTFHDNHAVVLGGVIFGSGEALIKMMNSVFISNSAPEGGALYVQNSSIVNANNCNFTNNRAEEQGGAIRLLENVTLFIGNSMFKTNHAGNTAGAISATDQSQMNVFNSVFEGNSTSDGALNITDNSYLHLEQVLFLGNQASQNGVVLNVRDESLAEIINSTFQGNLGDTSDKRDYGQRMKCLGNVVQSECVSRRTSYLEADIGLISVTSRSKCTIVKSQLLKNNGTTLLFVSGGSYLSVQASNVSWNMKMYVIRIDYNSSVDIVQVSLTNNSLTDRFDYVLPQSMFHINGGSHVTMKDLVVNCNQILDHGIIFYINDQSFLKAENCQVLENRVKRGSILYCEKQKLHKLDCMSIQ